MKIINQLHCKPVLLIHLDYGELFRYQESLYIKITQIANSPVTAVDILTGIPHNINIYTLVDRFKEHSNIVFSR